MTNSEHYIIDNLVQYWESKKRGQLFPSRKDIDPVEIPKALKHIILLDVHHNPLDFYCRLVGDHIAENTKDIHGLFVSDIGKIVPDLQHIFHLCQTIVSDKAPVSGNFDFLTSSKVKKNIRYVGLPLSKEKSEQIDMILCAVVFISLDSESV